MDVCHLTLSLTDSFMRGVEGASQVRNGGQVVNVQQNNVFQYQVSKPRREPCSLDYVKSEFRRTFSSVLFDAYLLHKARSIRREFSYRNFLELEQPAFHRIVRRLKRKGEILASPLRTKPRLYFLTENLADYQP